MQAQLIGKQLLHKAFSVGQLAVSRLNCANLNTCNSTHSLTHSLTHSQATSAPSDAFASTRRVSSTDSESYPPHLPLSYNESIASVTTMPKQTHVEMMSSILSSGMARGLTGTHIEVGWEISRDGNGGVSEQFVRFSRALPPI